MKLLRSFTDINESPDVQYVSAGGFLNSCKSEAFLLPLGIGF